jgi:hypothetical protein
MENDCGKMPCAPWANFQMNFLAKALNGLGPQQQSVESMGPMGYCPGTAKQLNSKAKAISLPKVRGKKAKASSNIDTQMKREITKYRLCKSRNTTFAKKKRTWDAAQSERACGIENHPITST